MCHFSRIEFQGPPITCDGTICPDASLDSYLTPWGDEVVGPCQEPTYALEAIFQLCVDRQSGHTRATRSTILIPASLRLRLGEMGQ